MAPFLSLLACSVLAIVGEAHGHRAIVERAGLGSPRDPPPPQRADVVVINGDAGFTAANGVSNPSASGTPEDPFIIGPWSITGSAAGGGAATACVAVANTARAFVIRGVECGGLARAGVSLTNVTNGSISGGVYAAGKSAAASAAPNTFGVLVEQSSDIKVSDVVVSGVTGLNPAGLHVGGGCSNITVSDVAVSHVQGVPTALTPATGATGIGIDTSYSWILFNNNTVSEVSCTTPRCVARGVSITGEAPSAGTNTLLLNGTLVQGVHGAGSTGGSAGYPETLAATGLFAYTPWWDRSKAWRLLVLDVSISDVTGGAGAPCTALKPSYTCDGGDAAGVALAGHLQSGTQQELALVDVSVSNVAGGVGGPPAAPSQGGPAGGGGSGGDAFGFWVAIGSANGRFVGSRWRTAGLQGGSGHDGAACPSLGTQGGDGGAGGSAVGIHSYVSGGWSPPSNPKFVIGGASAGDGADGGACSHVVGTERGGNGGAGGNAWGGEGFGAKQADFVGPFVAGTGGAPGEAPVAGTAGHDGADGNVAPPTA